MQTIIDSISSRQNLVIEFLKINSEISLASDTQVEFNKSKVLSIASFFEKTITDSIIKWAQISGDRISNFIQKKAVSRQYHTYFNWDASNINQFLGLFGEAFKKSVTDKISKNDELKQGMISFLQLGQKRNILVHENFAAAQLDWTDEEIIEKYKKAKFFVDFLIKELNT